ncbi:MAG: efflux RND transporter periplasmic adaptor subunit [Gemmatimonadota bacterium]|nr:efflux RND transporter periplasmic adaptor subunit [Gemmatimonadota bacterium]MDH3427129.1 efflux RND transporter periplasmic adaptor subunit [Gemmatimonadota bacterium]
MSHIHQLHPGSGGSGRESGGPEFSGMDVARTSSRRTGRIVWTVIGLAGLAALTLFFASLEPAVAGVDRDLLVLGNVQRGSMSRQVYGWGSFVPDRVQIVRAEQPGKIAVVYAVQGEEVRGGDRLIEMSNPEIEIAADKAEQKFAAVRAGMIALSRELSSRRLTLEADIAATRATYLRAEDELEERVSRVGKADESEVRRAQERVKAIAQRLSADEERLELIRSSMEAQLSAQRDELRWLESILESERARLRSLTLRATGDGLVEEVLVESGSRVNGGEILARVALTDRLKAEIDVYASEGAEVESGLPVVLESETAVVSGRVADVESVPGRKLIRVEVSLDENPGVPEGASPEVKAMIQLGTLENAVFVERPAYASSNNMSTVFRLAEDGLSAQRVKVRFGRGSVDRIEVKAGLDIGDTIIVSDISKFDGLDFIEIH